MIPLHRPPFGVGAVIGSILPRGDANNINRLEEAYARTVGCPCAVWLPSARAGIYLSLAEAVGEQTRVIAPAFTCAVVHEAVIRSRGKLTLADAAQDDFLMPADAVSARATQNAAVVLCELYGHTYELAGPSAAAPAASLRTIDLALSVPHPALFSRLQTNDFAVLSFGKGKTMYAGWGAMGFTANTALADAVRRRRDSMITSADFPLAVRRLGKIFLRTVAHYPAVYSLARKLRHRLPAAARDEAPSTPPQNTWLDDKTLSAEWRQASTHPDRALARWNIRRAGEMWEARIALAARYAAALRSTKGISLPKPSNSALSHYTIRINAAIRSTVKDQLYRAGIHTVTLWTFPPHLDRERYPNAYRMSTEVLNLPLSHWMSSTQVDYVCETLIRSVTEAKEKPLND